MISLPLILVSWNGQLDTKTDSRKRKQYINANDLEIPHKKLQKRTSLERKHTT